MSAIAVVPLLVFTHVSVIDVAAESARDAVHANQRVVVEGSRIVAVGPDAAVPPGARKRRRLRQGL